MLFQILFFISLSAVSLCGSLLIFQTRSLIIKEKFFSVLIISLLFLSILIINEYNLTETDHDPSLTISLLQRNFFIQPEKQIEPIYKNIPQLEGSELYLEKELVVAGYNLSSTDPNPFFLFIQTDKDTGLSTALSGLVNKLQNEGTPVLYLAPQRSIYSIQDWENFLGFRNINGVFSCLDAFNKEGLTPVLVFDNLENWVHQAARGLSTKYSPISLFENLAKSFNEFKYKIVISVNSNQQLKYLKSIGKKLIY